MDLASPPALQRGRLQQIVVCSGSCKEASQISGSFVGGDGFCNEGLQATGMQGSGDFILGTGRDLACSLLVYGLRNLFQFAVIYLAS